MKFSTQVWLLVACLYIVTGSAPAQDTSFAVTSKVAEKCGTVFTGVALQQDLEAQLRAASIPVSRVHTATLTTQIDCARAPARAVAATQCLNMSKAVSEPSAANGLRLATTWGNCQSYTCSGPRCGKLAISTQHTLTARFLDDYRAHIAAATAPSPEASPDSALPRRPLAVPALAAAVPSVAALPVAATDTAAPQPPSFAATAHLPVGVIYYLLYIVVCIALLFHWSIARPATRVR